MKTVTDVRDKLLEFVRADLVGPAHGPHEELEDQPSIRYSAGVLFPQEVKVNESAAIGGIESDDVENVEVAFDPVDTEEKRETESFASEPGDSEYDDTVTLANEYKPSAIGLTFAVRQEAREIAVSVHAAVYDTESRPSADGQHQNTMWKRRPLTLEPRLLPLPDDASIKFFDLQDELSICLRVSEWTDRRIVTASLFNSTQANSRDSRTFYQTGFSVRCSDSDLSLMEYRDLLETEVLDDEELSLEMMYLDRRVYALGHGCAANWEGGENGTQTVVTETIPTVLVPPVEPRSSDHVYLNMQFLQGGSDDAGTAIPVALNALCEDYEDWLEAQDERATTLHFKYQRVAASNLRLCRVAVARMRRGVEVLSEDPHALEAFALANRAILMQQHHSRLPPRKIHGEPFKPPAWDAYDSYWSQKRGYWRTFQLAFVLMTLPGLVDEHDSTELDGETIFTRDLVDLIWFPTGGGKTEAYLGLSAFLIFWRRLKDPTSVGCKVLMRYTLRLLTSQQFQRAASLISACELIRAKNPERFGHESVSIGLWVGMSLTPNIEKEAVRSVNQLARKGTEAKNPFQLLSCPWCRTDLNDKENLGYVVLRGRHLFVCPNSEPSESCCPFSSPLSPLPVCVVDESVYDNPPTLLIGTVDKFSMLAWRKRAGDIFHVGGGPELIIQDELHLISGALGSMVGLYEGVIDFLCTNPTRPKIIASTATIRRAREQCRNLYARPMFQFPPPALDASDSYFAVENLESPGRLYAGFLPTAASSPLTAQIRSVVALQQGLYLLGQPIEDKWIDPYWTLVQYFGSLKELGRAATFVKAYIPEFLPTMHRRYGLSKNDDPDCRRWMNTSEELTSRRNED